MLRNGPTCVWVLCEHACAHLLLLACESVCVRPRQTSKVVTEDCLCVHWCNSLIFAFQLTLSPNTITFMLDFFFKNQGFVDNLRAKSPKPTLYPATTHTYTHTTHSSSVTLTIHIRHWPPASPPLPPFAPRIKSNTPKITWWVIRVSRALIQPALLIETKGNYLGIPKS